MDSNREGELAAAFRRLLREQLTPAQWEEMLALNAREPNPNVCHSHDHIDANMTMAEAWEEVFGRKPDPADEDEADTWNKAWKIAGLAQGP
jgi:hypothetical protein